MEPLPLDISQMLYLGPCFEKTIIGRSLWYAIGSVKLFPNYFPLCGKKSEGKSVDKISYFFWHLVGTQIFLAHFQAHAPQTTFQGVCFKLDAIIRNWQLIDCPSV